MPETVQLSSKGLLEIADLSADEIMGLINTGQRFKEISEREVKKVPTLRGKTVINLFFEPSTRTRTSFEIAGKRLSADVINIAAQASSITKGETFKDTILNISAMHPDAIVIRHSSAGAARYASQITDCPIVNGGDGAHSHPTQALLDLMTIHAQKEKFDRLKITIVGDILHSRVARSNIRALQLLGAKVTLCAPPTLLPKRKDIFNAHITNNLKEAVKDADVIMMLRIQQERMSQGLFPSLREYSAYFCLTPEVMEKTKKDVIVLHPGPINRGVEISSEVADGSYSVILSQVTDGVAMRMAVLYMVCGGNTDEK